MIKKLALLLTLLFKTYKFYDLTRRKLQTLEVVDTECMHYNKTEPMFKIILREKFDRCHLEYTRKGKILDYYSCLDHSLESCGVDKSYVQKFKASVSMDKEENQIQDLTKKAPNLHECYKLCTKSAYDECNARFPNTENDYREVKCISDYIKSCRKECFIKHSNDKYFGVLRKLWNECARAVAALYEDFCRSPVYNKKENLQKKIDCIQSIIVFSEVRCIVDEPDTENIDHKSFSDCYTQGGEICLREFKLTTSLPKFYSCSNKSKIYCEKASVNNQNITEKQRKMMKNAQFECKDEKFKLILKNCTAEFRVKKDLELFKICRRSAAIKSESMCLNTTVERYHEFVVYSETGICMRRNWDDCKRFRKRTPGYERSVSFLEGHCRLIGKYVIIADENNLLDRNCLKTCFNTSLQGCYDTYKLGVDPPGNNFYNNCMTANSTNCTKYCHRTSEEEPTSEEGIALFKNFEPKLCGKYKNNPQYLQRCRFMLLSYVRIKAPTPCNSYCMENGLFGFKKCKVKYPGGALQNKLQACEIKSLTTCRKGKCNLDYVYKKSILPRPKSDHPCISKYLNSYLPHIYKKAESKPIKALEVRYQGCFKMVKKICLDSDNKDPLEICLMKNNIRCLIVFHLPLEKCLEVIRGKCEKAIESGDGPKRVLEEEGGLFWSLPADRGIMGSEFQDEFLPLDPGDVDRLVEWFGFLDIGG